jgi:hypothetical protein
MQLQESYQSPISSSISPGAKYSWYWTAAVVSILLYSRIAFELYATSRNPEITGTDNEAMNENRKMARKMFLYVNLLITSVR